MIVVGHNHGALEANQVIGGSAGGHGAHSVPRKEAAGYIMIILVDSTANRGHDLAAVRGIFDLDLAQREESMKLARSRWMRSPRVKF